MNIHCLSCDTLMVDVPAHKKRCNHCAIVHNKKEKMLRKRRNALLTNKKVPDGCKQPSTIDRHVGTVKPMFLVRGLVSSHSVSCAIMNGT